MTLLSSSLVMYLLVGLGVAGALFVTDATARPAERWFRVLTAVPFWPLYVPIVLAGRDRAVAESTPFPPDEMTAAIAQVRTELEAALARLDVETRDLFAPELERIHELPGAWTAQAERVREMDRQLALPATEERLEIATDRLQRIQQARRQNIDQLHSLRQRSHDDLLGTLAWVRELLSMLHLAKFGGAPAARVHELVVQIAASGDGLAQIVWRDEPETQITTQPATR